MRWLFPGTEIRLDARCLDCGQPIVVRMKDDKVDVFRVKADVSFRIER